MRRADDSRQRAANAPPLPLLAQAVELSSPTIRLLSMRKRAKRVETPRALNEKQRTRQGIIWLLKAAERGRKAGVPRDQRIAREVFSVLEGTSDVFKWLEERHRSAAANRQVDRTLKIRVPSLMQSRSNVDSR